LRFVNSFHLRFLEEPNISGFELQMSARIEDRKNTNSFRALPIGIQGIDFSSNDYLGLAHNPELAECIATSIKSLKTKNGATGSRLLNGNSELFIEVEKVIAEFHNSESALIYNSGYDANLGLFSTICRKNDVVIYDEFIHASARDGIRLSNARSFSFKHNDIPDLSEKINRAKNSLPPDSNVFIAVESIYSMDGDLAPLRQLIDLCTPPVYLIVDEAHATGLLGPMGNGLATGLIAERCLARVYTFGKAFGLHGAAITGSKLLINYLINFSRPFIFSTALPPHSIAAIKCAYEMMPGLQKQRNRVMELSSMVSSQFNGFNNLTGESASPVRTIIIPGNENVKLIAQKLQNKGFDVRPVLSPTVPGGKERLRICLHSFNTEKEVLSLCDETKNLI
jgi:8-amino-7-oxononanoate synthase